MNSAKSLRKGSRGAHGGKMSLSAAMRQLGIDKESMPGKEAEDLWNMLNDMAEKDPERYKEFIRGQMDEAKLDEDGNIQTPGADAAQRRGFRPEKGLAVKTTHLQSEKGKPVYINLCGFKGVEMPQDAAGKALAPSATANVNLTGLNIPLAVGALRECVDPDSGQVALVLDAVFHPWVTAQAREFSSFQAQVIELALTWCEPEARGKLSRKYAVLPRAYYGLDAAGLTAFFQVGEDPASDAHESTSKAAPNAKKPTPADFMARPETLLGALREESSAAQTKTHHSIKLQTEPADDARSSKPVVLPGGIAAKPPKTQKAEGASAKGPLVREVTKTRKQSAVKKGFLQNTNGALYGEAGSSEGAPTSLYQKAKIVDLNKMSPEEVQQVMQEHGGGARPAQPVQSAQPVPANRDKATREMLEQAMQSLSKEEKDAFDKIAEAADLEFAKRNIDDREVQGGLEGLFGDLTKSMGALGALLEGDAPARPASQTPASAANQQTTSSKVEDSSSPESAPLAQVAFKVVENKDAGEVKIVVDVGPSCSLADIDVEISERKVRLVSRQKFADTPIRLPNPIDRDSARARLSKKTGKLTIKASLQQK